MVKILLACFEHEEVGNMASKTSAIPAVRESLLNCRENLQERQDVMMDGRDIGTNVLAECGCENLPDCKCGDESKT